jgi:hypothetical protein
MSTAWVEVRLSPYPPMSTVLTSLLRLTAFRSGGDPASKLNSQVLSVFVEQSLRCCSWKYDSKAKVASAVRVAKFLKPVEEHSTVIQKAGYRQFLIVRVVPIRLHELWNLDDVVDFDPANVSSNRLNNAHWIWPERVMFRVRRCHRLQKECPPPFHGLPTSY